MGADLDLIQRTIVFHVAVMDALTDGAFNCLIRLHIHIS